MLPPQITLLTGGGTAQTSQTIVTGPNAPNIILNVNVTDTDGTVSQVQLFGGITSPNARPALLGTAALTSGTSSNGVYSYNWGNLAAGAYTFYWAATDNLGATAGSKGSGSN